jgi:type 1 glutamine amidotransferase
MLLNRLCSRLSVFLLCTASAVGLPGPNVTADEGAEDPLSVLIIDGQNNHDWQATTPVLKAALEACGRFRVEVATTPPTGQEMRDFQPDFAAYDVVLSNYNGDPWPATTQAAFEAFVTGGGGFVCVHAADNAFPDWPAYNRMIGLGGWGGRTQKSGPYIYLNSQEQLVRDTAKGPGGTHGPQRPFPVVIRNPHHPITEGLPRVWMHTKDELYAQLRGPAEQLQVLATAYADPSRGGTGRHEPMLMTVRFGEGRIFHTTLGHATYSMKCIGFVTTLQRGTEWAATGTVTIPVPDDFPTATQPQPWSVNRRQPAP